MTFHLYCHTKTDGRSLWLYSQEQREYTITNDLPPLEKPTSPYRVIHPLRDEPIYFNPDRNKRTVSPPPKYNPLAAVQPGGYPGEIPVTDFEVAVFENRWPGVSDRSMDLVDKDQAYGRCEVVVYTPNDKGSLANLPTSHVDLLLSAIGDRYHKMMDDPKISYVLPFENRGDLVGTTLPHPHGQIYAFADLPPTIALQMENAQKHKFFATLLDDLDPKYIVAATDHTVTFCPPFARYPFETWILPKERTASPQAMSNQAKADYAAAIKAQVHFYDSIFEAPAPFAMWHALPARGYDKDWPYHVQFWPLQSGIGRKKYLASVEQITGLFLIDVMPEYAAQQIRDFHAKI